MVEHLKVLMVEHLKVMAALSVEPAYASLSVEPPKGSLSVEPAYASSLDTFQRSRTIIRAACSQTNPFFMADSAVMWNRDTESNPAKVLTKKRRSDSNRDLPP